MGHCPTCHSDLVMLRVFGTVYWTCSRCYTVEFTSLGLSALLRSDAMEWIERSLQVSRKSRGVCRHCSRPEHIVTLPAPKVSREANLRLLAGRKYWHQVHLLGEIAIHGCNPCGTFWMNSRTLCALSIDWDRLDQEYREKWHTLSQEQEFEVPTESFLAFMKYAFPLPQIVDTPGTKKLEVVTFSATAIVTFVTWQVLRNPWLELILAYVPGRDPLRQAVTLVTYSLVHANWEHWFGNFSAFLVFSPLVEEELDWDKYLLLLVSSAIFSALVQGALFPYPLIGFSGVVSAVICFFCVRFPTSVISLGVYRFAAPTALLIFIGFDLQQTLSLAMGFGNVGGLAHLGGALVGYLFHLWTPPGDATRAFKEAADKRTVRMNYARDWKSAGPSDSSDRRIPKVKLPHSAQK